MLAPQALPLTDWQSFYVIIGSSGAALTGLTFIVITITSDAAAADDNPFQDPVRRLHGLRAFITPTVVHFASTLWLSALMSVPGHSARSLAVCLGLSGLAGVGYCARVAHWMRAVTVGAAYQPFTSDWIWGVIVPALTYLGMAAAASLLPRYPLPALDVIGGLTLLLLFIGLRNAWDVVVWTTVERHTRKDRQAPPPADR
jgi:hypothetical protein